MTDYDLRDYMQTDLTDEFQQQTDISLGVNNANGAPNEMTTTTTKQMPQFTNVIKSINRAFKMRIETNNPVKNNTKAV